MAQRRFTRREPTAKTMRCKCGASAKLMKRRNFPHGRKSGGISYFLYKCKTCNSEYVK